MTKEAPQLEQPVSQGKWNQKYQEAQRFSGELLALLTKKHGSPKEKAHSDELYAIQQEGKQMLLEAGKTEDEIQKCAAYHALIGSSTDSKDSPQFDFPGALSVVELMKKKIAEFKKELS